MPSDGSQEPKILGTISLSRSQHLSTIDEAVFAQFFDAPDAQVSSNNLDVSSPSPHTVLMSVEHNGCSYVSMEYGVNNISDPDVSVVTEGSSMPLTYDIGQIQIGTMDGSYALVAEQYTAGKEQTGVLYGLSASTDNAFHGALVPNTSLTVAIPAFQTGEISVPDHTLTVMGPPLRHVTGLNAAPAVKFDDVLQQTLTLDNGGAAVESFIVVDAAELDPKTNMRRSHRVHCSFAGANHSLQTLIDPLLFSQAFAGAEEGSVSVSAARPESRSPLVTS